MKGGGTDEKLLRFLKDEGGVTALEWALVAGLITTAIIDSEAMLSGGLGNLFNAISEKIGAKRP